LLLFSFLCFESWLAYWLLEKVLATDEMRKSLRIFV
jgi:hypothetical protein